MNITEVSVVVVSWNTQDILCDCLRSIYEQGGEIDLEVIVIDNASTDGSVEMVKKDFPQVTLIENSQNRGFAAACNQGIKVAGCRYILILNSDIVICESAIAKTVMYADNHPEVGIVGCQVWENQNTIQMTCFRFPSLLNLLLETFALNRILRKNRFFGREWMLWWTRDSESEVDVVSGMFMLVRRRAIDEVGLMDESYFLLYEETDWCYRFSKAGWKRTFWPGAKIIHVDGGSQSRKQANPRMIVQFRKSTLIFYRKHRTFAEYLSARLILVFYCILRCASWGVLKLYKKSLGRDFKYETEKLQGFWWAFIFCATGREL
jgi:GT2 family glycosyltransferase